MRKFHYCFFIFQELREIATDPDSQNLLLLRNFRALNRTTANIVVTRMNSFLGEQELPLTYIRYYMITLSDEKIYIITFFHLNEGNFGLVLDKTGAAYMLCILVVIIELYI